jgi:hypothetical protein
MTSTFLRRRLAPLVAAAALIAAGTPALLAPAEAGASQHRLPRHTHASTPPDRVGYVERVSATTSAVPQRTEAI